ncbi:MAG: GNAT family N-acetyltransferase [Rhodobacterales bacterium]|nr:GNAT family N-acetyltransferase [Rhodobacterales bacterium]NCT12390.1 GNAT family N-acetyltransferase [Rhodobacterales bacterium]
MRIERIEELRLGGADEAAIAALLGASFGTDFGGRSCFMQRHHVRLVARDDGIIGHVGLTFRQIRQGARLIPILGLADVATDPARRGEGIAGRLVAAAIDEGRAGPVAAMALFGTAQLYAAAGFVRVANRLRHVDLLGAVTGEVHETEAHDLMVLPLDGRAWDDVTPVDLLGHLF